MKEAEDFTNKCNQNTLVISTEHTLRGDAQQLVNSIVQYISTRTNIIRQHVEKLGLTFLNENVTAASNVCFASCPEVRDEYKTTCTTTDLLNYIYALLHSSAYRESRQELFPIGFHQITYPKESITFWKLVKLGSQIRNVHLMES